VVEREGKAFQEYGKSLDILKGEATRLDARGLVRMGRDASDEIVVISEPQNENVEIQEEQKGSPFRIAIEGRWALPRLLGYVVLQDPHRGVGVGSPLPVDARACCSVPQPLDGRHGTL